MRCKWDATWGVFQVLPSTSPRNASKSSQRCIVACNCLAEVLDCDAVGVPMGVPDGLALDVADPVGVADADEVAVGEADGELVEVTLPVEDGVEVCVTDPEGDAVAFRATASLMTATRRQKDQCGGNPPGYKWP